MIRRPTLHVGALVSLLYPFNSIAPSCFASCYFLKGSWTGLNAFMAHEEA